jgi:hypothetical protein
MSKLGLFLLLAGIAMPALAYIDPNAGGLLAQILTPLLLAAGIAWTSFRRKIASIAQSLINRVRRPTQSDPDGQKD